MFSRTALRAPAFARAFSTTPAARIAKITLIGRLAHDPETVTLNNGDEVVRYTVGSKYKQGEEMKVSWFRVAAFNDSSKTYLQSLKKGTLVHVDGSVRTSTYEGEDGKNHVTYNIYHRQLNVLSKPKEDVAASE